MTKLEAIFDDLNKAALRLEEVLELEKTAIHRDSAIQRFEFCFDLAWKSIKVFLEEKKKVVCNSPTDCFREAYRQGLIEYDEEWLKTADMRNKTSHTYNEEFAEEVYKKLPIVLKNFKQLLAALQAAGL